VFFSSSFEKPGSYMFMKYVKMGAVEQVELMLKKDPYFIYGYDEVIFLFSLTIEKKGRYIKRLILL
jgi:hypothetical protein